MENSKIKKILLQMSQQGYRLFRNNTGMAWQGQRIPMNDGIIIKNARPVKFGLCEGSSDLIGWKIHTVQPEDIGKKFAIFTAIEIKTDGYKRITEKQQNFINQVKSDGGIGEIIL